MAEISGLSVRVSSSVAQFRAGMNAAQESAQDLSLSLRRLGSSSSAAERDLDAAGRSATTTGGQFAALTAGTNGLNASFMGLSVVTLGALVPSLLTLSTVIAPLLGAMAGFVAVAGAIIGVGLVGTIGAIATHFETFKREAQTTLELLESAFGPALDTFAAGLLFVIDAFQRIIPELVPAQSTIQRLVGNFTALGIALVEALPALVDLAVTLTEEFLPGFVTWSEEVLPQIPGLIMSFVSAMQDAGGILSPLVDDFAAFVPVVQEFGTQVLATIVPAIGRFTRMATRAMRAVNDMDSSLQGLVISGVILLPVLTSLIGLLSGPLAIVLGTIATIVAGLGAAFVTNFAGIRDTFNQVLPSIRKVADALKTGIGAFMEGFDMSRVMDAIGRFEETLSAEYTKTIPIVIDLLNDLANVFTQNKDDLQVLGAVAGTIVTTMIDILGVLAQVGGFVFRNILAPVLGEFISLLDSGLNRLTNLIRLFSAVSEGDFDAALGFAEDIAVGEDKTVEGVLSEAGLAAGEGGASAAAMLSGAANTGAMAGGSVQGEAEQSIRVVLQEETDVIESRIADGAERVVTQKERRTRRNSGSSPTP